MEQVGDMKFYTHEEMLDGVLGKKGTSRRDKHDEAINALLIGEAIKEARLSRNLTQKQLGEMIGVKKAQVCRIENGRNLTFSTIARAFRAMGVVATLDMAGVGKVALW